MSDTERLPATTRLGRVALRVTDLDRMVGFYRDVVGLTALNRSGDRALLGVDGETLLVLREDGEAPVRGDAETGLYHTAFRVPTRAALGNAVERVRDRWQLDGASDHLVSEAVYLTDPEDNGIEIYRDRRRSDWPRTDDGRVRIDSLPLDLGSIHREGDGSSTVPSGTDVGHVHLEVSSIEAARSFYVDGLGMEVQYAYGDSALFVSAGGYHHHIGLNTWHRRREPSTGRGLDWFELRLPDARAIAVVSERVDRSNGRVHGTDRGIDLHDPDRIEVRLRIDDY